MVKNIGSDSDAKVRSLSDLNKLYRCPPSPPPSYLYKRERSFILDAVAVSNICRDYANCNPKLGTIIPPYNGQKDSNASNYFQYQGIRTTLHRTGQTPPGTPIEGIVEELFFTKGAGYRYLNRRNQWGCGRSYDALSGHAGMYTAVKPIFGYNGDGGYRRNTPNLRRYPSTFGKPVVFVPQSARSEPLLSPRLPRKSFFKDNEAHLDKDSARMNKQAQNVTQRSSRASPTGSKVDDKRSQKSAASDEDQ